MYGVVYRGLSLLIADDDVEDFDINEFDPFNYRISSKYNK